MKGFESIISQFPFSSKILYTSDSPFLRWGKRLYQKNLILIYDTLIAEMASIFYPSLICTHCHVTLNFFPLEGRVYFSTPRIWVGLWLALAGRMCRGEAVPNSEPGLNRPCESFHAPWLNLATVLRMSLLEDEKLCWAVLSQPSCHSQNFKPSQDSWHLTTKAWLSLAGTRRTIRSPAESRTK